MGKVLMLGTILHAGLFVNGRNQGATVIFDFDVASRARLWLNFPRTYGIRSRHRTGNPRPAQNEIEDVVRLRECVRLGAEHERLPRLPRPARRAARAQRRGVAPDGAYRFPAELRDSPLRQIRPEELFLS